VKILEVTYDETDGSYSYHLVPSSCEPRAYAVFLATITDLVAQVLEQEDGVPRAQTMAEIAKLYAEQIRSPEPRLSAEQLNRLQ
jgi:hypothetical protein